jgi:hypothetical protein
VRVPTGFAVLRIDPGVLPEHLVGMFTRPRPRAAAGRDLAWIAHITSTTQPGLL